MATFIPFQEGDRVDSVDRVFASAWNDAAGAANDLGANHLTASTYAAATESGGGSGSANFFQEIFSQGSAGAGTGDVQYSIAYGHVAGSGSRDFSTGTGAEGFSAAKAVYNQTRNLVYGGDETQNFSFPAVGTGTSAHTPSHIYVININRSRYKNAIRMGNLALVLGDTGGTPAKIHLTDNSVTTSGSANAIRPGVGREFLLVTGSDGIQGTGVSNLTSSYGFVYPDAGLIVLNGDVLDGVAANGGVGLASDFTSNAQKAGGNPELLRKKLVAGGSFIVDSQEDIASKFYFVRVKNQEFNYTTNDSFTENDGTLKYDSMIDNPQTYITTVGLYNDAQDLLAVAKLSTPLPKDFTKEALIKVKLDY